MRYTYLTVQVPPNIKISSNEQGNEAAAYLERILNEKALGGWEFQSVEAIGVKVAPGCLEALKGTKESFTNYYVIVFRREAA